VYLGGCFSAANLTTPALTLKGYQDALLIKQSYPFPPGAPTGVMAAGGNGQSTVTFTAPASNGGAVITGYAVTSIPAGGTDSNAGTTGLSHIVTGLANGTSYTFTVTATNSGGTGAASSASPAAVIGDWAKSYGLSVKNAYVNATATDSSGNVYIAGHFDGATLAVGGVTMTRIGTQDAFAAKFNAAGTVAWAQNYGGSGATAVGNAIAVDSAGNVYLGGNFSTSNLTTPGMGKIGPQDAFALKLDGTGATTWAKNFGGSGAYATVNTIAVDVNFSVYLGGNFQTGNLLNPALTKIGTSDAFALKLTSSGSTIWAKNYGGSGATTYGQGIAADNSGNVYLCGTLTVGSLTTPVLTKIGTADAFVLKLSSVGTTTWAKNYYGSGAWVNGNAIALDGAGNLYLGGDFAGDNLTTPALTKIGTSDAFALKLDSSGTPTWAKNYGGSGGGGVWAYGNAIAVDSAMNVYLGGTFKYASLTTPALTKIGTYDAFALKLDATGATTWSKNYGGSGASAYGTDIALDSAGNVYLGGNFSTANLTSPALTKIGTSDALLIKQSGPFPPSAPTAVIAISGNNQATISFTTSADNGGAAITGYTVTSSPGGLTASGTSSPLTVTGLTNGTSYTFTITATNSAGMSSAPTLASSAPGAPTAVIALGGNGQATVTFTAPVSNGGAVITGYTVTSIPAGGTDSNAGSTGLSHIVTGLTNGTSYTFTVTATNSIDTGSASGACPAAVIGGWAQNYGLSGSNTYVNATTTDSSGNVYIAGYFNGATLAVGGVTLTRIGSQDAFAAKFNAAGTVAWAKN
ncbi:MAG: fibronectin type III domain-containing protein, partial [Verrucomicrobiota bacterium]